MCYFVVVLVYLIELVTLCTTLEKDIFCSSEHLHQALIVGNQLLKQIDVKKIERNATKEKINRYKFDMGFYSSLSEKWTYGIARHPIYIYSMVRDLYKLSKLEKQLPRTLNMTNLPTKEDFTGTVSALVRLQYTYNLKAADMAAGMIDGERSVLLSAEYCLMIGAQAHVDAKLENAIDWLNLALSVNSSKTNAMKQKIYAKKCSCEYDLKASKVLKKIPGTKEMKSSTSDARISKGHYMAESDPKYKELIRKLKRRVQAITGLRSESYATLQKHDNPLINDRIATFLFYLNEVVAGGATVFPRISVRIPPEKGDAILWYNFHRNGYGNMKTFHAACPILLGTKWIANLWIGRHRQEFVRPCSLNEHE